MARPGQWGVSVAAVLGALLPDLSLYLMVGWALYMQNVPANIVFDSHYFGDQWQAIFAVDNGFVLWGALFLSAVVLRRPLLRAFPGGRPLASDMRPCAA
ncbi:MAG: hypothetical protein WA784_12605 [Albidovulum sp.]